MIFNFNITIRYLILDLIISVLTYDSKANKKPKGIFTSIRVWILSFIIILGVIEILLFIYLVLKFLKRRRRKENEREDKSVVRKEKLNEQLESNSSATTISLKSSLSLVQDKSEMDQVSHVNPRSESISECKATEHDQDLVLKEDRSITAESTQENFSLTEVNEYTASIRTFSEYKQDSDSKENNETTPTEIFSDLKIDVFETHEVSINSASEIESEESSLGQEKSQVINKNEINDSKNDFSSQGRQNVTPLKQETENTFSVISEENKKHNFQEELSTYKISEKEIPALPVEGVDIMKTFTTFNNEKTKSTTDTSSIEVNETIDKQETFTEENSVEQKVVPHYFSQASSLNTEISKTTTDTGTKSNKYKEESLSSEGNSVPPEHSPSIKSINKRFRKNRSKRMFSEINSSILRDNRGNIDNESSE